MAMTQWIPLDAGDVRTPSHLVVHGTSASVAPSPYEIPRYLRVTSDDAGRVISVEFRYLEREEPVKEISTEGATFAVGRSSGRLYRVSFESSQDSTKKVGDALGNLRAALSNLTQRARLEGFPRRNYEIASKIITHNTEKIRAAGGH